MSPFASVATRNGTPTSKTCSHSLPVSRILKNEMERSSTIPTKRDQVCFGNSNPSTATFPSTSTVTIRFLGFLLCISRSRRIMGDKIFAVRQSWLDRTSLCAKLSESDRAEQIREQVADRSNERTAAARLAFCPAPLIFNEPSAEDFRKNRESVY